MPIKAIVKRNIIVGLLLVVVAGLITWQFVKKSVVKEVITDSVTKSTQGFYNVDYDSSNIDELKGNATFYGLRFREDSASQSVRDAKIPAVSVNVFIKSLKIVGANIPSFLAKKSISAETLIIESPNISIFQNSESGKITKEDSLALYKEILGKFSSISVDKISIKNGDIKVAIKGKAPHTIFNNVNIQLENLLINENKQYDDIISYFIKGLELNVEAFQSQTPGTTKQVVARNIHLNARTKRFLVQDVSLVDSKKPLEKNVLKAIQFSGLNIDAFIYQNKFLADSLSIGSGTVFINQNKNSAANFQRFEIENDFFANAQLKNVFVRKTDVYITSAKADAAPLLLKKVNFTATGLPALNDKNSLQQILNAGKWNFHSDGVSTKTSDAVYAVEIGAIDLNEVNRELKIASAELRPLLSWESYVKTLKVQHDLYDFRIKNMVFSGLSVAALLNEGILVADRLSLSPTVLSSNDRTVPYDRSSKVGKYPHQQLLSMDIPIDIKVVAVNDGIVTYRERGRLSKQSGDVVFKKIAATITGFTNIRAGIEREKNMVLNASATFLNSTKISTRWVMPLQKLGGNNLVTASFSGINSSELNRIIEPLGMASIRKGSIDGLRVNMQGDDYKSYGEATLLYHGLKVDVLKSTNANSDDFERKTLLSFAANVLAKNSNPRGGVTRSASMENNRDTTKSFFNFIFKGIFEASKRTVIRSL